MQRRAKLYIPMIVLLSGIFAATGMSTVIPCLSGFVRDSGGAAVVGGDLDFINPVTGVKLVTPGDNTDAAGFYNVCVLPGVYDVTYAPPLGTRLMGKVVRGVDLTVNVGKELDVTLLTGNVGSGTVRDEFGAPVGDVDVDVDDVTDGRIFTPDDNSDPSTGAYRVVVPTGTHRFRFEPPPGSRLRGAQVDSVTVDSDVVLDVTLEEGVILDGRVEDASGNPIFDVDVDLREQLTGRKVFIANNSTDAAGNYAVAVPTGLFQLRFAPPRGSRFVAILVDSFTIGTDLRRDQVLDTGFLVSIVVIDTLGAPISGADVDVKIPATGAKLFTPNDRTDALGRADVAIPPGVFSFQFDPPVGTVFDRVVLADIAISADTTITVVMKEVARRMATGRLRDALGAGIAGASFHAHLRPGGREVFIPVDLTDFSGAFSLSIPLGNYDVFVVPPAGSRFVGKKIVDVTVAADSAWGDIVLDEGWLAEVTVTGDGRALASVDLDFAPTGSSAEIFTPYDNTDAGGRATVVLPAGDYTLVLTPPSGSVFEVLVVEAFTVGADTSATYALARRTEAPLLPFALRQNYPNPFRDSTTLSYELGEPTDVTVSVYDVSGRLVKVIDEGQRGADVFTRSWDGTDRNGARVAAGVYFVRLETTLGNEARKMVLVR